MRRKIACAIIAIILGIAILAPSNRFFLRPVDAQIPQTLASRFAPALHFTKDEKFYPTSVDYIISSSILKQRASGGSSSTIDSTPTPNNLGRYTSPNSFLSNKLGSQTAIAVDYTSKARNAGYYAYVHVVRSSSSTVIQYWLFYVYNNGPLNDHEGDIEVIQVLLDGSDRPQRLLLSQHSSGQNAAWDDAEKIDTHPVVYVAQGSHANYFRPYQGKVGIENDVVADDGITVSPSELKLIILGEKGSHPAEQGWLDFPGRWGYWGTDQEMALGMTGPLGPAFNQDGIRWAQPQVYVNRTFSTNNMYFLLAWLATNFLVVCTILAAVGGAWKILGIVRMLKATGLLVNKFLRGRGSLGLLLGAVAIAITIVGLGLPWYSITASSQTGPLAGKGDVSLMMVDGVAGLKVNMFLGSDSESSSGYKSLIMIQIPFAVLTAIGLALLALDIVGVKSSRRLGMRFILGSLSSLLPCVVIYIFISMLPSLLPLASSLNPSQQIPTQVEQIIRTVAANPFLGTTTQQLPVVGITFVKWGFGVGAYLFVIAFAITIAAGTVIRSAPELQQSQFRVQTEKDAGSPAKPSAPKPVQAADRVEPRFCLECGARLQFGDLFCKRCGTPVIQSG